VSGTLHQASCVAIEGRALLIEGPPGSGKSSLALALIDRGAALVGDDGVRLERREGRLWALPPPAIAGLIEIRNVGLVTFEPVSAAVALLVRLDAAAERHPDGPEQATLLGCAIPLIRLWPDSPVLALRAQHALRLHGVT
jgi:serine kinase of HPr protein (carbohydrate metabolism regulator)